MPDEQIDRAEWPFHPAADIFLLLDKTSPEFKALAADIKAHGLVEPIQTLDGMIIIGRNRYNACLAASVEPWIEALPEGSNGDPLALVISSNRHRARAGRAALGSRTAPSPSRPGGLGSSSKCHGGHGTAAKPNSDKAGSDPGRNNDDRPLREQRRVADAVRRASLHNGAY
jgi:hypothetical protein